MDSSPRLSLPAGTVDVWWAHARPRSAQLLGLLDPLESTRHSALRQPADRDRFLSAHALARIVLAGYQGTYPDQVPITASCKRCGGVGHGKPELDEPDPQFRFSLTHSGARVGVAVARVPVGIDVELLTDPDADVQALALAPAEATWLRARPAQLRAVHFGTIWARKEAVLKATGDGLSVEPASVQVSAPDLAAAVLTFAGGPDPAAVQLTDLAPGAGHVGALALLTDLPHQVRELDGEELLAAAAHPPSIA